MSASLIISGIILIIFGIGAFSFLERIDLILAYYTGIAFVPIGIVMVISGTATAIKKEKTKNGMIERTLIKHLVLHKSNFCHCN